MIQCVQFANLEGVFGRFQLHVSGDWTCKWMKKLCRYFYFFFDLGPNQVKCQLLNHDILLNEFLLYFWKYPRAPILPLPLKSGTFLSSRNKKSGSPEVALVDFNSDGCPSKYQNLIYDISQNMLEIHSKICHELKVNFWLEMGLGAWSNLSGGKSHVSSISFSNYLYSKYLA